jgi:hypothetical protein
MPLTDRAPSREVSTRDPLISTHWTRAKRAGISHARPTVSSSWLEAIITTRLQLQHHPLGVSHATSAHRT